MKRNKLFILSAIFPAIFALSGCVLSDIIRNKSNTIVVDLPEIEIVKNLKINLKKSNQKTLNPVLSNDSIKNPKFNFATSNNSVATVSSDGVVTGLKVGTAVISIYLKSNSNVKASVKVTVVEEDIEHYDYTIMLYMCGSDLEYDASAAEDEQYHFFTEDIKEILKVKNLPDTVKIIIETGGTTKWNMTSTYLEGATNISSKNLQRWEVNNETNKLTFIETLPTNQMASADSFTEFLNWGLDDYNADQMGVIISGHGGGIAGCAYDDNYTAKVGNSNWQHTLSTYEVAKAANAALTNSEREKFTWIGYDCCVMQCADIATINADYFEYMVGSQENEIAIGWNHDVYLEELVNNSKIEPTVFLPKICDAFLLDKHSNDETGENICYQTLSVLDLSKVDSLITSFNAFCNTLGTGEDAYINAKDAFNKSYNKFGDKIFGLCDFSSLMIEFKSKFSSLNILEVQNSIDNLVLYKKSCSHYIVEPCGVNAFFPEKAPGAEEKYPLQVGKEDYSNSLSTKFTPWQTMCVAYGNFGWDSI